MNYMNNGLIDGTLGIGLFCAALGSMTSDDKTKEMCARYVKVFTERLKNSVDALSKLEVIYPNVENVSYISGVTGKILGSYLISKYTSDTSLTETCRKLISLINKMELGFERTDIFNGLAGLLKLLCKYDELYAINGVPEICSKLADRAEKRQALHRIGGGQGRQSCELHPDGAISPVRALEKTDVFFITESALQE